MKLNIIYLLAFLVVQVSNAQNTVTLFGTITHPKGKKVYVRYYSDYLTYEELTADSATLDRKGNFSMNFSWDKPYPATFYHGDEITEMFLSPNDHLKLTLDTKQFDETVVYEGIGIVVCLTTAVPIAVLVAGATLACVGHFRRPGFSR
jgi:hypothetical protein